MGDPRAHPTLLPTFPLCHTRAGLCPAALSPTTCGISPRGISPRPDRTGFCFAVIVSGWILRHRTGHFWYWGHWDAAARPDSCLEPTPASSCFSRNRSPFGSCPVVCGAAIPPRCRQRGQIPTGAPHSQAPPCFGFSCVSPSGLLLTQALCVINSLVSTNEDYPCRALVSWRRSCVRS